MRLEQQLVWQLPFTGWLRHSVVHNSSVCTHGQLVVCDKAGCCVPKHITLTLQVMVWQVRPDRVWRLGDEVSFGGCKGWRDDIPAAWLVSAVPAALRLGSSFGCCVFGRGAACADCGVTDCRVSWSSGANSSPVLDPTSSWNNNARIPQHSTRNQRSTSQAIYLRAAESECCAAARTNRYT